MKINHAQVAARYRSIMHWLTIEGRVDVVEAAIRLGVAQETIRRDLRALERDGRLQRVHGGAVPVEASLGPPVVPPLSMSQHDDLALSRKLWDELPHRGTLLLGAGRLTLALAQVILSQPPEESGLTVVTNSLDAALVLSRASSLSVYNIGGTVSPVTRAQEGDWALQELARFSVDTTVVCPAGISVERGLSSDTPAAAAIAQAEVSAGRHVIVVADAHSLGAAAFVQFATLDEVDQIIVTGSPAAAVLQPFYDRGIALTIIRGNDGVGNENVHANDGLRTDHEPVEGVQSGENVRGDEDVHGDESVRGEEGVGPENGVRREKGDRGEAGVG